MPRHRAISLADLNSSQESGRAAPNTHPGDADLHRPSKTPYRHRQPRAKARNSNVRQRDGDASQPTADEFKDYSADGETSTEPLVDENRAKGRDYGLTMDVRLLEISHSILNKQLSEHYASINRLAMKLIQLQDHSSALLRQEYEIRKLKNKVERLQEQLDEGASQSSSDSSGEE